MLKLCLLKEKPTKESFLIQTLQKLQNINALSQCCLHLQRAVQNLILVFPNNSHAHFIQGDVKLS